MHKEALNDSTKEIWNKCVFLKEDFYLAGGTALALQLGHRISVDLDFFSDNPINRNLLKKFEEILGSTATPLVNKKDEITFIIKNVKITLLHYPLPLLQPKVPDYIVSLASARDIASMKAYALGRRQSLKDYADLYSVFYKNIVSIKDVIKDANQKYGDTFNDRLFLEELVSAEDFEEEEIIWLKEKHSKGEMAEFFKNLISNTDFLNS